MNLTSSCLLKTLDTRQIGVSQKLSQRLFMNNTKYSIYFAVVSSLRLSVSNFAVFSKIGYHYRNKDSVSWNVLEKVCIIHNA